MYSIETKTKIVTITTKKVIEGKKMDVNLAQYVGFKIREIRKGRNILQQDLAKLLQMSRANVSNIENGRTQIPLNVLEKFCKEFNIKSSELLPF